MGAASFMCGCPEPVATASAQLLRRLWRRAWPAAKEPQASGRHGCLPAAAAADQLPSTSAHSSILPRRYADEYGLAVLLVNQIVDSVTDSRRMALALPAQPRPAAKNTGHTGGLRLESLGREVVPALGLAWANCVNTRLFLSRCAAAGGSQPARYYGAPSAAAQAAAAAGDAAAGGAAPALRKLQVVFSPHLPQRECYYVVEATGVRGLAAEELEQHEASAAQAAWREEQQQAAWREEQLRQIAVWGQQQAWQEKQQGMGPQPGQQQQQQQQQQGQHGGQWGQQQQLQQQGGQWGQQQSQQRQGGQWGQQHAMTQPRQQPQQCWGAGPPPQNAWQHGMPPPQHAPQQQAQPVPPGNPQLWPQQHGPQQWQSGSCPGSGGGGSGPYQQTAVQQHVRQPLRPQQQPHANW